MCLLVHCTGISIVWSSFVGFSATVYFYLESTNIDSDMKSTVKILLLASTLFAIALWIYYAVVADALTSVAHFAAVLLGGLIGYCYQVSLRNNNNIQHDEILLPSNATTEDDK